LSILDTQIAVIGGGVVGCAVAHALARRGVEPLLLEAEPGLALGACRSERRYSASRS
jgi:2-polyprenyl-6-methoxyphenol hydroxylase-like FAD-dependent oxidoreductase